MATDEANIPHPPIVDEAAWRTARLALLDEEKELTRQYDRVNAHRRRLPMVRVEKQYAFDSPNGKVSFLDLFEGRRQLIVYHFMFDPEWDKGCMGCTGFVDAQGSHKGLAERDTTFALVSRAPLAKLEKYKAERGWNVAW